MLPVRAPSPRKLLVPRPDVSRSVVLLASPFHPKTMHSCGQSAVTVLDKPQALSLHKRGSGYDGFLWVLVGNAVRQLPCVACKFADLPPPPGENYHLTGLPKGHDTWGDGMAISQEAAWRGPTSPVGGEG